MSPSEWVLWAGLLLGLVFGAVGQVSGFCLHRGLQEAWHGKPLLKLRSFALALAVAIIGTQVAVASGWLSLGGAIYTMPVFSWALVPLGGVLFGVGMTLANGCGARSLVLLGQGNLRALLVLLCLGVAGYATLTGILAPWRQWLADATAVAPGIWGQPVTLPYRVMAFAMVVGLLVFAGWQGKLLRSPRDFAGGLLVGGMVVGGWLITGVIGADDFDPVPLASLTFVAPIGEAIQYLMIATGMSLGFGGVVVFGTLLGSWLAAVFTRSFVWQGFESASHMRRFIAGGVLMGVGGALALGCSVGQGLTGMSTLSLASLLALLGIILGSRLASRSLSLHPPIA